MFSNIFYVHPYLGKWSNLTISLIFSDGWFNHQLVRGVSYTYQTKPTANVEKIATPGLKDRKLDIFDSRFSDFWDVTHIPLEDTPEISPTVYEGISFFVGVWGSLGYLPRVCGQNHWRFQVGRMVGSFQMIPRHSSEVLQNALWGIWPQMGRNQILQNV